MDFGYWDDETATNWFCILGGAQQLAKILQDRIRCRPDYNHRVTSIAATGPMKIDVAASVGHYPNDINTTTKSFSFNAVLNTTTLGCLRHMDLSRAGLPYPTALALRSLGYGPAAKVAIKFSRAWWIHDLDRYSIRRGGLGHSDLNLRTCVYPSYNIYDPSTSSAVLLCSYTWQQDAQRIGSLTSSSPDITHTQKIANEADLKTLLLRDLAQLHCNDLKSEEEVLELISGLYVDHHAHDWSADPNTAGAFAFFRPQQFSRLWGHLIRPAGDLIIAGEAASPHHAWVVGALESVVHGLHAWMQVNAREVPELQAAAEILAREEARNPYTGLPPYMTSSLSEWHGLLGYLGRLRHLNIQGADLEALRARLEQLRLQGDQGGDAAS
jgi:monoamine oxidase